MQSENQRDNLGGMASSGKCEARIVMGGFRRDGARCNVAQGGVGAPRRAADGRAAAAASPCTICPR